MNSLKNNQYYLRYQVIQQPIKKGQKLYLYFGQFDKIPQHIINEQDNSRIIVEGQKRIYINKKNEQIVLEEGFQSLDILQLIYNVRRIRMEFDTYCDTQSTEFLNFVQKIINLTKLTKDIMIHFVWVEFNDDSSMIQILNQLNKAQQVKRLKFKLNINYQHVIKCITQISDQIEYLSLDFLDSAFRKEDKETEYLFAQAISSLKNLQKLSLNCQGEFSFKILKNILSILTNNDGSNSKMKDSQNQENTFKEKQKCLIQFKLKQLSLNLKCLDFIPLGDDLNSILPELLFSNPSLKFKISFPKSIDQHTIENASKINIVLQNLQNIFKDYINLIEFSFSTSGNSNYKDQERLNSQILPTSNKSIEQSLKITSLSKTKIEMIDTAQNQPQINIMNYLNFLQKQKTLKKLCVKLDQETNLVDLTNIIQKSINSLFYLNIRIRNNFYTNQQLNKLVDVINQLIYLRFLCLDVQYEEHILFKLNSTQLSRLVQYKQGSMVQISTKSTLKQVFQNDPIKLFNFYSRFKSMIWFIAKFNGFEFCKDSYKVYKDESYSNHIFQTEEICQKILQQMYLQRKYFVRIITALLIRLQLSKQQINDLFSRFHKF